MLGPLLDVINLFFSRVTPFVPQADVNCPLAYWNKSFSFLSLEGVIRFSDLDGKQVAQLVR